MEIYVFGSITSGDVDHGSDTDVLVVTQTGDLANSYPDSWSVYSVERVRELFSRGTLFAWHLHRDAVRIWPKGPGGLLATLGQPSEYRGAISEISALRRLALQAVGELAGGSPSETFELGLIFLATRDIAMAAAPLLLGEFRFSRFTPLDYEIPKFPLERAEYEFLMACRRASTRGTGPQENQLVQSAVIHRLNDVLNWIDQVHRSVSDGTVPRQDTA
jgi:hypothetical protein